MFVALALFYYIPFAAAFMDRLSEIIERPNSISTLVSEASSFSSELYEKLSIDVKRFLPESRTEGQCLNERILNSAYCSEAPSSVTRMLPSYLVESIDLRSWVPSTSGFFLGNHHAIEGFRSFLGIPYACAPIGNRRWRAAKELPAMPNAAMFDARKPGARCPQIETTKWDYLESFAPWIQTEESEDCLNLNIFAPSRERSDALGRPVPVMVFLHGGQFTSGGNTSGLSDPANFVRDRDVIVVVPNYRLGIWGFLAAKELEDGLDSAVGNYALSDVVEALRWTFNNIESFGGDPNKITLAGHGSGACMINYLLASSIRDLNEMIVRAILFSGSSELILDRSLKDRPRLTQGIFDVIMEETLCIDAEDLRRVSCNELKRIATKYNWVNEWGPLIDGTLIPASPKTLSKTGQFLNKPILITTTKDDGTIYAAKENIKTKADFRNFMRRFVSEQDAEEIVLHYMSAPGITSSFQACSAAYRDFMFKCPALNLALAASSFSPAYYHEFSVEPLIPSLLSAFTNTYGSFHGSEVIFLFDSMPHLTIRQAPTIKSYQEKISLFMSGSTLPDSGYLTDEICDKWRRWKRIY